MKAERITLASLIGPMPQSGALQRIAGEIRGGAVFVYPTETVYGIGGIVDNIRERRIIEAKKRPPSNPMIIAAGSIDDFEGLGLEMHASARALARRFWPGNLTLVVQSRTLGRKTGVRVSPHPFLAALSPLLKQPLYSTSANISGERYDGSPDAIFSIFSNSVDFMVDAGPLPPSSPSTVVDFADNGMPAIVREGAIPGEDVFRAIN